MNCLTITLSAIRAKQLELSLNPPRRQNGQPIRHITREQAENEGFIIDTCCYPHYGYVMGNRFISSVENVHVYTDLEADLLEALGETLAQMEGTAKDVNPKYLLSESLDTLPAPVVAAYKLWEKHLPPELLETA